jgi:hypothetical protein
MKDEIQIRVNGDQIRFIYNDDLAGLMNQGKAVTKRASHVEPCDGEWQADLTPVSGPVLGPFPRRDEALAEEVKWLNEHKIPVPA